MCCKQRTYTLTKSCKCNIYKKEGDRTTGSTTGAHPPQNSLGSIPGTIRLVPLGVGTPTRPDPSLTGNGVRQAASRAFAPGKFLHGGFQIGGGKVRPAFLQEYKFCECAFPQEKITATLVATRPNQQVDFRRSPVVNFRKHGAEGFGRKLGDFVKAARGVIDGFAGGIVDRQPKMQARAPCRGGFRIRDGLKERGMAAVPAP